MMILFVLMLFLLPEQLLAQQPQPEQLFSENCAGCHGDQGRGSAKGPALTMNQRVAEQSAEQLGAYLERGNIAAGMPSFSDLSADYRTAIVRYLRRLNVETIIGPAASPESTRKATFADPQPGDWLTYNG